MRSLQSPCFSLGHVFPRGTFTGFANRFLVSPSCVVCPCFPPALTALVETQVPPAAAPVPGEAVRALRFPLTPGLAATRPCSQLVSIFNRRPSFSASIGLCARLSRLDSDPSFGRDCFCGSSAPGLPSADPALWLSPPMLRFVCPVPVYSGSTAATRGLFVACFALRTLSASLLSKATPLFLVPTYCL